MNRRESLKSLLVGSFAGGLLLNGCATEEKIETPAPKAEREGYGRTPEEEAQDEKLFSQQFFNEHELETVAVLCDIILPATPSAGSATEAEVTGFIEFIAKDMPYHQLSLRGGIMWLDNRSRRLYQKEFIACNETQQKALLDEIAYPEEAPAGLEQGVRFFNLMRNLTLTGYYTTKMGIEDLGYKGNTPNAWDGVPEEVLKEHGMSYEKEWLAKCVDQKKPGGLASWDQDGNLIS
jgi:hypothetical protein